MPATTAASRPVQPARPPPGARVGVTVAEENAVAQNAYQSQFTAAQRQEADNLGKAFPALHFNTVLAVYISCECDKGQAARILATS
jgi:hypothetical protein